MNGLKRNTQKLFSNGGKLFAMATDLPMCGLVEGLEDPLGKVRKYKDSKLDAFLLNVGIANLVEEDILNKKLILRTSAGGSFCASEFSSMQKNHVSPEVALAMGADAVVMMITLGGADYNYIQDCAASIDRYHRLHIPVIVEVLSDDFSQTQSFEIQANGARIAAELGADVVKAFYTERFEEVVSNCPVPIVLAGGPKGKDIAEIAADAVRCGVKGFCFGRNLYQNDDASELIETLDKILRG